MKISKIFHRPWFISAASLLILETIPEDLSAEKSENNFTPSSSVLEQRGRGERGGGQNRRRRPRSNDFDRKRHSPFSDFPWQAQQLLEKHRQTLRNLHPTLRRYTLTSLLHWDEFFPVQKQKFKTFLKKAETITLNDFQTYFNDSIPNLESDLSGKNAKKRQRIQIKLTPEELAKIGHSIDQYVLSTQNFFPALVVITLNPVDTLLTHTMLNNDLLSKGTLLEGIVFPNHRNSWMATLQPGCKDAVKGNFLRYPSWFEYRNWERNGKLNPRTIALFLDKHGPPVSKKNKRFRKKTGPQTIHASDFEKSVSLVEEKLKEAKDRGYSNQYIESMVKPELTTELLKIKKLIKGDALTRLIIRTLLKTKENRKLENTFLQTITEEFLQNGQPDILLVDLKNDGSKKNQEFLHKILTILSSHVRYKDRSILTVVDSQKGKALLLGEEIEINRKISGSFALQDFSATLSHLAKIKATQAQGVPLSELISN